MSKIARIVALALLVGGAAAAQDAPEPDMTLDRLAQIIAAIDPDAEVMGHAFELTLDDIPVLVVTDTVADRMRAMVPIRSVDGMSQDELLRLMQANFDSALDARYAVAQGRLWGVFIHPLSPLQTEQFLSGLAQTVNVAKTYGSAYSGGASVFGGGDSPELYRELLRELLDRSQDI
ncbi:MAG: hypothetical protein NXH82_06130 [Rhodobacteraceae bacterium]|nr:hypothetical protein [Paracoccaceae bacterium]